MQELLSGSGAFVISFFTSLALLAAFITVYCLFTSYQEVTLIRGGNRAAALSLGGAIFGFVIPVAKVVSQSTSLLELVVWAVIAFVAQLLAYGVTFMLLPKLRKSITDDHVASGLLLATLAAAIGILNAASMAV